MRDPYVVRDGILVPPVPVAHREEEYDHRGFEMLSRMQRDHFWYAGRHRFLLHAVRRHLARRPPSASPLRAIDLGGGCGGWIAYLQRKGALTGAELALADSSEVALNYAAKVLPAGVARYQIDLMNLQWEGRWDAAFLLDVLEHIPAHDRGTAAGPRGARAGRPAVRHGAGSGRSGAGTTSSPTTRGGIAGRISAGWPRSAGSVWSMPATSCSS